MGASLIAALPPDETSRARERDFYSNNRKFGDIRGGNFETIICMA